MKKFLTSFILIFITAYISNSQTLQGQRDKAEFITAVQSLEDDPLAKTAKETRKWALRYSQDVNYPFCDKISLLFFAPEVRGEVMAQYLMKLAVFELEHSGEKYDITKSQAAGMESSLKVYEKIIKVEPQARYEKFESLIKIRNKNELTKFVKSTNCKL